VPSWPQDTFRRWLSPEMRPIWFSSSATLASWTLSAEESADKEAHWEERDWFSFIRVSFSWVRLPIRMLAAARALESPVSMVTSELSLAFSSVKNVNLPS